jgi:integrase
VRSIGKRAGLGHVNPHMLRAAFIMADLDADAVFGRTRAQPAPMDRRTVR